MEEMRDFNFIRHLSYPEIAEIEKDSNYLEKMIQEAKKALADDFIENTGNPVEYDKVFRFHIIYDEICGTILGKMEQIPIQEVVLKIPEPEIKYQNPIEEYAKANIRIGWKDRLKILFTGKM